MARILELIVLCGAISARASSGDAAAHGGKKSMPQHDKIASETEATTKALRLTGFEAASVRVSALRDKLAVSRVPFLWRQVQGRTVWRVEIAHAALTLPSGIPGYKDRYPRTFTVVLDQETGQLIEIFSTFTGQAPDMRPQPTAESAESQLRDEGEIYSGFPEGEPQFTFLQSLDIILAKGMGSPFLAKEFYAVYVMESRRGAPGRAVWSITLRGLPPLPARGPQADRIPAWQRNHMRNVIDAETGAFLFATNSPQPL